MGDIEKLIESERAKIALFKEKIVVCESRIAVLQSMLQESKDAVDVAAGAAVAAKSATGPFPISAPKVSVPEATNEVKIAFSMSPKRPLGDVAMTCLRSLESGGKTFEQIVSVLQSARIESSRHNTRCTLISVADRFGFIKSPRKQYYEITQNGLKYLEVQKGESPATANSGAFSLQPASSQGASTKGVRHGFGTAARTTPH